MLAQSLCRWRGLCISICHIDNIISNKCPINAWGYFRLPQFRQLGQFEATLVLYFFLHFIYIYIHFLFLLFPKWPALKVSCRVHSLLAVRCPLVRRSVCPLSTTFVQRIFSSFFLQIYENEENVKDGDKAKALLCQQPASQAASQDTR